MDQKLSSFWNPRALKLFSDDSFNNKMLILLSSLGLAATDWTGNLKGREKLMIGP